ncbi:MAG TPA: hypothetical protein DD434_00035, partial [Bacteroidales bacterium]|nr:hypothetical protein [Bacteroidales bacterium]
MKLILLLLFVSIHQMYAEPVYSQDNKSNVEKNELIQQQPLQKTITGKIIDEQGEPIIGVNIVEKGTS